MVIAVIMLSAAMSQQGLIDDRLQTKTDAIDDTFVSFFSVYNTSSYQYCISSRPHVHKNRNLFVLVSTTAYVNIPCAA